MRLTVYVRVLMLAGGLAVANGLGMEQAKAAPGSLTVQAGVAPLPPVALVNHGDAWRYFKGTSEPAADWKTVPDASLDLNWLTGPGGIGYGDGDDATVLSDMRNAYSTVYLRQTFAAPMNVDPSRHLRLVMDYDDGFVAWLDGVEIARSSNVAGAVGSVPPFNAVVFPDHEASAGGGGNPPLTLDLGPVGERLAAGNHVLAVMGINGTIDSSDVSVIADLSLTGGTGGGVGAGGLFALSTANTIALGGSNTVAGSVRVTVNGDEAAFNLAQGTWAANESLWPGLNRFHVAAVDGGGTVLASVMQDVVFENNSTAVGGVLGADTSWGPSMGIVHVTNDVVVPAEVTLSMDPDLVVLVDPGVSILAWTNGTIHVQGGDRHPVIFLPSDGISAWREISASGAGAAVDLRFTEVADGQMRALGGGTLTIEDSLLRDYHVGGRLFVEGLSGGQITMRRTQISRYNQIHIDFTPTLIEDCLLEQFTEDGTDFQGSPANIMIRRTTYRNAMGSNTDGVDTGMNLDLTVDHCLIHDIPDKGVSIAENSEGTQVLQSLIYRSGTGISCYGSSNCVFTGNTVAACTIGMHLYERNAGEGAGEASGTNNIVWGNTEDVVVTNGAILSLAYSDIGGGGVLSGPGNINEDPLFQNAAAGDYEVLATSPVLASGFGGTDMGVGWPVGGIPAAPLDLAARGTGSGTNVLAWEDDSENEDGFVIYRSTDGLNWMVAGEVSGGVTQFEDAGLAAGQAYLYQVRATNSSGNSQLSNLSKAIAETPAQVTVVGGTLASSMVWGPDMGTILVLSDVIVPAGVTLTVEPGGTVQVTNDVSIEASGGVIQILGTEGNLAHFSRAGSGPWGHILADGDTGSVTIRYAEIEGGAVRVTGGASAMLEDSYIHDYMNGTTPMLSATRAGPVVIRRCHVSHYYETLFQYTLMLIEDCLFENLDSVNSDGIDFDGAPAGSTIRRCTIRNGTNSNTDAIDLGSRSLGVTVADCRLYNVYDKGVSIGEDSFGILVTNCLIYAADAGVAVKDSCTAELVQNTMTDCNYGFHLYRKTGRKADT